jgi:porin
MRCTRVAARLIGGLALALGHAVAGSAQSASSAAPPPNEPAATAPPSTGLLSGLPSGPNLLGAIGGLRPWLSQHGATLSLQETSEALGNVTGGVRRGFEYDGLTQATLQLDTQAAFGWSGGTFNASALQIHGRNLSADNLLSLQTASGIEADRATRLWELWYQQKFDAADRVDLKIGQQTLDQEFLVSQNALLFVNTAFGWPMVPSADLPGGGPAYPLSALGVRARGRPAEGWTVLLGVFNGNPAPGTDGDPQALNPSGTSFPLNGGALVFGEVQYAFPTLGTLVRPGAPPALPGTYKLGFWYDSENFPDQERDNTGLSLADPASAGVARLHRGQLGLYAVVDQMVWQDAADSAHNLNVFARVMGTPQADSVAIDFSLNAGLTLKQPVAGRDNDTVGIGVGYAHVSRRLAAYDRDAAAFNPGTFAPVQGGETFIELTYQYQLAPWCQLQPDFQYVFNPGGGIADPAVPTRRIGDEAVLGVRTIVSF